MFVVFCPAVSRNLHLKETFWDVTLAKDGSEQASKQASKKANKQAILVKPHKHLYTNASFGPTNQNVGPSQGLLVEHHCSKAENISSREWPIQMLGCLDEVFDL